MTKTDRKAPECPVANALNKSFALDDCRRIVALVEAIDQTNVMIDGTITAGKTAEAELTSERNHRRRCELALQVLNAKEERKLLKETKTETTTQLMRAIFELAGGTLWQDQQPGDDMELIASDEGAAVAAADGGSDDD